MIDRAETRRLAAIVLVDVVGYSRLMGTDEAGTLAAVTRHRRAFLEPTVARFGGRLVKAMGDGFLLEFPSVVDAVRCSIRVQRGMAARQSETPTDRRLVLRMGINLGDVVVQGGDVFGDGVNVAARLETLSPPGGMALSRAAHDHLGGRLPVDFADIGPQAVKNIDKPVEVLVLDAEAIAALPAEEPEATVDRRAPWRRPGLVAVIAGVTALLVGGAAWQFGGSKPPERPFRERLLEVLVPELQASTVKARARLVDDYLAAEGHKAIAIEPKSKGHWWTAEWPTADDAVERLLERCQIAFGEPCALIAVDDRLSSKGADGTWAVRDMPRTHYAGPWDRGRIPGLRDTTLKRADVAGYATATGFKAAAFHVRGLISIVSGAASSRDAQASALARCNSQPNTRQEYDGTCFLYAVDNRVVLSERRTAPVGAP